MDWEQDLRYQYEFDHYSKGKTRGAFKLEKTEDHYLVVHGLDEKFDIFPQEKWRLCKKSNQLYVEYEEDSVLSFVLNKDIWCKVKKPFYFKSRYLGEDIFRYGGWKLDCYVFQISEGKNLNENAEMTYDLYVEKKELIPVYLKSNFKSLENGKKLEGIKMMVKLSR